MNIWLQVAHCLNTCVSINTYFTVFSDLRVLLFQDLSWTFSWIVVIVQSLIHVRLLQPHGLQHARLPCPSPIPRVCSDSCPLSQWYNLTISPLANSFSFCIQLFPASGSFLCIRWPKYWSFSFNISLSSEYSRLVPFRIHWFDLFAVQGTLKSLLQHHNLKASILQCSHFLMICHAHTWLLEKP